MSQKGVIFEMGWSNLIDIRCEAMTNLDSNYSPKQFHFTPDTNFAENKDKGFIYLKIGHKQ